MRVILIRLSAVGDIVHTWPLAVALRSARPDLDLTWVVEERLRSLVDGHPAVDRVLTTATRRWRQRPFAADTRREVRALRSSFSGLAPDLALDPQGVLKSAIVTHWTGAGRRVGLARPWRREWVAGLAYNAELPGSSSPHVIATNVELVRAVGGAPPPRTPSPDGRWLLAGAAAVPPDVAGSYAVLLPATAHRRKEVPVSVLGELGKLLAGAGLEVLAAWGPGELGLAEAVAAAAGSGTVVRPAPATGLLELARLLVGASLVVGGDTGPTHMAASLGTPTVAVFTATDWRRNAPLGARVEVVSTAALGERPQRSGARTGRQRPPTVDDLAAAAERLLGIPLSRG